MKRSTSMFALSSSLPHRFSLQPVLFCFPYSSFVVSLFSLSSLSFSFFSFLSSRSDRFSSSSEKLAKVREPKLYIYDGDNLLETVDVENMSSDQIVKELAAKGIYRNKQEESPLASLQGRLKTSVFEKQQQAKARQTRKS